MPRNALRLSLASLLLVALSLVGVTVHAQGAAMDAATAEQKRTASQEYLLGKRALEAKRFDEALDHFKKSYATVKSPNSHFMVARALREKGRNGEAYDEAKGAIQEAESAADKKKYAETADAARQLVVELEKDVAFVSLSVDAPEESTLHIGDRDIDRSNWNGRVAVDPGTHTVVLETPNKRYEREIQTTAGEETSLSLPPPPEAATPAEPSATGEVSGEAEVAADGATSDGLRTASFVSFGLGAIGGIVFGVFGGLALSTFNDLDEQCPNKVCSSSQQEEADRGNSYQTAANVGLVVGIVGITAGVGLLIASFVVDDGDEEESNSARLLVTPRGIGVSF
jgi:hypothetical protein